MKRYSFLKNKDAKAFIESLAKDYEASTVKFGSADCGSFDCPEELEGGWCGETGCWYLEDADYNTVAAAAFWD